MWKVRDVEADRMGGKRIQGKNRGGLNTFDKLLKGQGRVSCVRMKRKQDIGERMSKTNWCRLATSYDSSVRRGTANAMSARGTVDGRNADWGFFSKFKVRRLRDGVRAVRGIVVGGTIRRLSAKRQHAGRTWFGRSLKFLYTIVLICVWKKKFYYFEFMHILRTLR